MELFQLETFLAVAEEKSFSRAATRMHRTQSAVSQTISKLEDELGERLFDRSSRDGSLTDAGQVLQTYAKELLNVRGEAQEALKELRMLHQGKLVIAANEFTARYLLPVLHSFHRMHPMIRIQVMRTLAREVPAQVLNHDVEFGVVSFRVAATNAATSPAGNHRGKLPPCGPDGVGTPLANGQSVKPCTNR